jgi:hypothetical protein
MRNPFTPKTSELFYGREAMMRSLLSDEQQGQSVVLIGGRRCGKTRILQQLNTWLSAMGRKEPAEKIWRGLLSDASGPAPGADRSRAPVALSLQGQGFTSAQDVRNYFMEETAKALEVFSIEPPPLTSPMTIQKWLLQADAAAARAGMGGLAFLIDEIESIFGEPWASDIMSLLRGLDDSVLRARLWIVLVGSNGLETYRHPKDGSPPLNVLRQTFLKGLEYDARRRMMQEPFTQNDRLPPSDVQMSRIDALAGGNVWLLTHLLERAFGGPGDDLESFAEDFLTDQFELFERWAKPLDEKAWEVYRRIASAGRMPLRDFSTERLAHRLLEYQALIHETPERQLEIGPELFRKWAEDEGKVRPPYGAKKVVADKDAALPPGYFRYEVALSYTSKDKAVADELAKQLRALEVKTFYDQEIAHEMWGADLARALPSTYERDARVTVLLVSEEYAQRRWPLVEAAAALAKAIRDGWNSILLVSLDGARLPDVPDSVVWLDLKITGKSVADVALALVARFKGQTMGKATL